MNSMLARLTAVDHIELKGRYEDFILVEYGMGIACGIMSGGRFITGSRGMAGELGHTHVQTFTIIASAEVSDVWKRPLRSQRSHAKWDATGARYFPVPAAETNERCAWWTSRSNESVPRWGTGQHHESAAVILDPVLAEAR